MFALEAGEILCLKLREVHVKSVKIQTMLLQYAHKDYLHRYSKTPSISYFKA